MDKSIEKLIRAGEGLSIEFKRCGNKPEKDVFETICSFANRQGGNLLLGVLDDGTVEGISRQTAESIQRNIINVMNDPNLFNVAPMAEFESFEIGNDKVVIKIWIPMGSSIYSYKGVVYDRSVDVDIKLKSNMQKSAMAIRKQNYYTEQTVYPWVTEADLEMDLLDDLRKQIKQVDADHVWLGLADEELLQSAKLYARDPSTGERGFNLAAVMLLGKEDVILDIAPTYRTDVVLKRRDGDRYDERLICKKNLIRSYGEIVSFCERWLPGSFALDGSKRVDVRGVIVRELVANCLMHREYMSPIIARVSIEADGIRTKNASRALFTGPITLENLEPTPKNPIIANFFNQLGWAEELGSGTRVLYKYSNIYTGAQPELIDGDVFSAFVPSPGMDFIEKEISLSQQTRLPGKLSTRERVENIVDELLTQYGKVSAVEVSRQMADVGERTVRRYLAEMVDRGALQTEARGRATVYWR